jgi:hypothetical protein
MPSRAAYLRADAWLADLRALHAQGLSDRAIARELSRRYPRLTFTRRRVHYWRAAEDRVAQDGECVPRDRFDIHHRRAVHQLRKGLGHLPCTLRQREADILALLRERGPLTRPEIARALGVRWLRCGKYRNQHWLGRLRRLGLVETQDHPPARVLYRIAQRALPLVG